MSDFQEPNVNDDGWCDWLAPIMKGYQMMCCDCGLIHELEMRVLRVAETHPDGEWSSEETEDGAYRVVMRVKRIGKHALPQHRNKDMAA